MTTKTATASLPAVLTALGMGLKADHLGMNTDKTWGSDHDSWKVRLNFQGRSLTTDFHMGTGHNGKAPECADVIYSLVSDAECVDGGNELVSFEDFCSNLGYDTDSRKVFKAYNACKKTLPKLQRFLGDSWEEVVIAAREF